MKTMLHGRLWIKKFCIVTSLMLMMEAFSGLCLTCRDAEYKVGQRCCPKCLAGNHVVKHCTDSSTSCKICPDGTYSDEPNGEMKCFECARCDPASGLRVKRPCTPTSDALCAPMEGFYCLHPKDEHCVTALSHRSCAPGQYVSKNGTALKDTVCSFCSEGTFSDGTFTSCRPHTQCESLELSLLKQGTAAKDAECGEQSSNIMSPSLIVIVVLAPVVLAAVVLAVTLLYCLQKKISSINMRTKNSHGQNHQHTPMHSIFTGKCLSRPEDDGGL